LLEAVPTISAVISAARTRTEDRRFGKTQPPQQTPATKNNRDFPQENSEWKADRQNSVVIVGVKMSRGDLESTTGGETQPVPQMESAE
jgi:hypothetical protein